MDDDAKWRNNRLKEVFKDAKGKNENDKHCVSMCVYVCVCVCLCVFVCEKPCVVLKTFNVYASYRKRMQLWTYRCYTELSLYYPHCWIVNGSLTSCHYQEENQKTRK
uniref:Uncharacterized protein n=1 Tax=Wuchereria bancrofti TaxID=6293 RepID=A0A1I8EL16_WUCBA